MTPKEKATDIYVRMLEQISDHIVKENSDAKIIAKQCAIIASKEVKETTLVRMYQNHETKTFHHPFDFWKQIIEELEKL